MKSVCEETRGMELIIRYKRNYSIPEEADISEAEILAHWELEKQLTKELMDSTPLNRWDVFNRCYTRLYAELGWLNSLVDHARIISPPAERYGTWVRAIGEPPQKIYEIGSGKGIMIHHLAEIGHLCKGTEITKERGEIFQPLSHPNLKWGVSDGVHLNRFEPRNTYDVVVSDQVIEHLHPDDLAAHLQGVHGILIPGGRYILNTPHLFTGPHDISRVFNCDRPRGMHLREYTFSELGLALKKTGFSRIYYNCPAKLRKMMSAIGIRRQLHDELFGLPYRKTISVAEMILSWIRSHRTRRAVAGLLRWSFLFRDSIFLIAQK